jgi:hypothetical protein
VGEDRHGAPGRVPELPPRQEHRGRGDEAEADPPEPQRGAVRALAGQQWSLAQGMGLAHDREPDDEVAE